MELITLWAIVTTIGTAAFAYISYRRSEVMALAFEVVDAYSDKTITEEEYKLIVDKLKAVLYKK